MFSNTEDIISKNIKKFRHINKRNRLLTLYHEADLCNKIFHVTIMKILKHQEIYLVCEKIVMSIEKLIQKSNAKKTFPRLNEAKRFNKGKKEYSIPRSSGNEPLFPS